MSTICPPFQVARRPPTATERVFALHELLEQILLSLQPYPAEAPPKRLADMAELFALERVNTQLLSIIRASPSLRRRQGIEHFDFDSEASLNHIADDLSALSPWAYWPQLELGRFRICADPMPVLVLGSPVVWVEMAVTLDDASYTKSYGLPKLGLRSQSSNRIYNGGDDSRRRILLSSVQCPTYVDIQITAGPMASIGSYRDNISTEPSIGYPQGTLGLLIAILEDLPRRTREEHEARARVTDFRAEFLKSLPPRRSEDVTATQPVSLHGTPRFWKSLIRGSVLLMMVALVRVLLCHASRLSLVMVRYYFE